MGSIDGYSDLQRHWIAHDLELTGGADATDIRSFEITERGLEPDEMAELVRAVAIVSVTVLYSPGSTTQAGVGVNVGAGFNLANNEFLEQAQTDTVKGNAVASEGDTDEQGQIYAFGLVAGGTESNGVDGVGGAAGGTSEKHKREFPNGGPVLDVVDDFTSRIKYEAFGNSKSADVKVRYLLEYHVTEGDGRPRFGR